MRVCKKKGGAGLLTRAFLFCLLSQCHVILSCASGILTA